MAKIQWERIVLFLVGVVFLLFAIAAVYRQNILAASGITVIALLCLAFSNLTRFKRIKALGMEAELWEEKQQEAADLIDLLKLYTNQIVMGSVMNGRWASDEQWAARWRLFRELSERKPVKGVVFDYSDLRKQVEDVFIFDMCIKMADAIRRPLEHGLDQAATIVRAEFPNPITDVEAYNKRSEQRKVPLEVQNAFRVAKTDNLARRMLQLAASSKQQLKENFGVTVEYDPAQIARLEAIANLADNRPLTVTQELIEWADH